MLPLVLGLILEYKPYFFVLRIYLVSTGKQRLAVKAPTSDDGSLIKVGVITNTLTLVM